MSRPESPPDRAPASAHAHGHDHPHDHGHGHGHAHGHDHVHGVVDPSLLSSERGIRTVKASLLLLLATGCMQVVVVWVSGSVALLADTIHNFADATTAVPIWIAFRLSRRPPDGRFTYGYGRVEDLAGLSVVAAVLFSAITAGYQSVQRFLEPQPMTSLGLVASAALIGFIGNETVAWMRLRTGRAIGSAALIADGHHARIDGLSSLAVLGSTIGAWFGFPLADPIVGLIITAIIFAIVWESSRTVGARLLDTVEPRIPEQIRAVADVAHPGALQDLRARWIGHRLCAELTLGLPADRSLTEVGAAIDALRSRLLAEVEHLAEVRIVVEPRRLRE